MGKVIKVSNEAYNQIRKISDETGLGVSEVASQSLTDGLKAGASPTPVVVKPNELCADCTQKIESKLLPATEADESFDLLAEGKEESGGRSDWGWVLVGLLVLAYLKSRQAVTRQE